MWFSIVKWIKFPYLWLRYGSPVKADETVVLFPQSAHIKAEAGIQENTAAKTHWVVPVHAWVVEKESGTFSRFFGRVSLLSFLDLIGVVNRRTSTPIFENRLSWFMADREMNKKVRVTAGDETFVSPRTSLNGHVRFDITYSGDAPPGSIIKCHLADLPEGKPPVHGKVQLVPEEGLSIISDIDDTIKISDVTDRRQLVRGLFFDKYKPAPGMPGFYQNLLEHGAMFHYISASPWQLYPSLEPFLEKYFPFGCLSQRHFYVGDRSFVDFFRSSMEYKIRTIEKLLQRYPKRKFILIGDSGEKDPEVYLQVARRHTEQIRKILIREVYSGTELRDVQHNKRWEKIKTELDAGQGFHVFHEPTDELITRIHDMIRQKKV